MCNGYRGEENYLPCDFAEFGLMAVWHTKRHKGRKKKVTNSVAKMLLLYLWALRFFFFSFSVHGSKTKWFSEPS